MRICMPTENDDGLNSIIYGHFGSAPYFIVYDTEKKVFKTINNGDKQHAHGQCNPLSSFEENPIDIMVTGGIGYRALERLQANGVKAFKTTTEITVSDVINSYLQNKLKEIMINDTCGGGHMCH